MRPHPRTRIIVSATRDGPRQLFVQASPSSSTPVPSKIKKFGQSFIAKESKDSQPLPIVDLFYGCEATLQDNGVPLLVLPDFGTGKNDIAVKTETRVAEGGNNGVEPGVHDDVVTKSFRQLTIVSDKGEISSENNNQITSAAVVAFSSSHLVVSEGNNAEDTPTARMSESSCDDADHDADQKSQHDDDEAAIAEAAAEAALDAFESSEARDVILSQLRARGRTLTSSQLRYIALQIKGEPCTAHLLTLVAHSSYGWRSFDNMNATAATPAVPPMTPLSELLLCDQILRELEPKFGVKFVRAACGFITWAKRGVSGANTSPRHTEQPSYTLLPIHIIAHLSIHHCNTDTHPCHLHLIEQTRKSKICCRCTPRCWTAASVATCRVRPPRPP